ncbi:hypothetical protein SRABI118_03457 [Massilia sp. Bi118]|uniref:hypothetical protein n=1 Tax=Massilia sp. Bi118 TaxID=2822346 RepID=UPI001D868FD2|nr:hypothetical protein [Massilia sp. Bi118]CAH0269774.1 hypothetical protein SRABI118_03457 [Massilia sp. Bi118]
MASLSFPPLLAPVLPAVPAGPALPVGPVAAVAPAALLAEMDNLPLPLPGASASAPAAAGATAEAMQEGAAMRPDQLVMARQLTWPNQDGGTLASSWRSMVRSYGTQLTNRDLQARPGQLPLAMLQAGQDPRVLRQMDQQGAPFDAWRFTVHAGSAQDQHLRVVQEDQEAQQQQKRRRARAALRLELVLQDGTIVTVQAEPLADGVRLELCAPDAASLARLRALQPELETAVARAGLRVLGWKYRDSLPMGPAHIRLPSTDAASALSLPVFRAMAEMALVLPAH